LKLIKEFVPLISHSIYEQIILHMERILEGGSSLNSSFGDFIDMYKEGDFIRDEEMDEWTPSISKLNKVQLNEISAKEDRRLRYKRRHGNATTTTDYDIMSKTTSSSSSSSLVTSISKDHKVNASRCAHCGCSSVDTPLMRKGPSGDKTLCNKCGLAWQTGRLTVNENF
jgi:chromatin structure-remodeling complex subunit SFH1